MRLYILPGCFCLLILAGCVQLTEDQRNQVAEANIRLVRIEARIRALYPKAEELGDKIKDIIEKVARGQMPKEEGEALIALFKSEKTAVETEIRAGIEDIRLIGKTVKAINAAGVSWHQQLWLLLPGLLGGAAAAARGYSKGRRAERVAGVLSRAGNVVAGFGAAVHAEGRNSGVSVEETNRLWTMAGKRDI